MGLQYVNAGTLVEAGSGNPANPGHPIGILTNDVEFLWIVSGDNIVSGLSAGWTKEVEVNQGTVLRGTLAWHRYTAGDATPAITHTGGDSIIAIIFAIRGLIPSGDPFDVVPTTQGTAANATATAPTLTPASNGTFLLLLGAEELTANTSGAPSWGAFGGSSPTPTLQINQRGTGLGANMVSMGMSWGIKADATATGARTATVAGEAATPTQVLGLTAALKPDPYLPISYDKKPMVKHFV
jgi:hypothetical protein